MKPANLHQQIATKSKLNKPIGIANDMPDVILKLLMPTTSPSKFTSGPPEFPNVIEASVCIYFIEKFLSPRSSAVRFTELILK